MSQKIDVAALVEQLTQDTRLEDYFEEELSFLDSLDDRKDKYRNERLNSRELICA